MKKRLLLVIVIIILAILALVVFDSLRFKLTDSSLKDSVYPIGSSEIVYFFNKDLNPNAGANSFVTTIEPAIEATPKIDKKTLHIIFTNQPKNDFTLTIRNIKSISGDTISSFTQKYTAKEVPESELSQYELARRLSYVDVGIDKPDIAEKYFPIDVSPQYKILYGRSLKYPNDLSKGAIYIYSSSVQNKHDALQMIYDIGYDPSDYEIVFKEIED